MDTIQLEMDQCGRYDSRKLQTADEKIEKLLSYHPSTEYSDQIYYMFIAKDLTEGTTDREKYELMDVELLKTEIVIKDRIPTSRHEDIKVKIIKLTPTPKKKTKLNICSWSLHLDPQEKIELNQVYEIENPVDKTITGF